MPKGGCARYPVYGQAWLAGLLAALLLAVAGRPVAAQGTVTFLSDCQAVARYDSRTVLVTWRTTQERPNDQIVLTYTVDNGASWLPLNVFYTDGSAKAYTFLDGWQADGTVIGYKVTVRNPATFEAGASTACLVQINAVTATPSPTGTATPTVPRPTTTLTPRPSATPTPTSTSPVSPLPLPSGTASPAVRLTASVTLPPVPATAGLIMASTPLPPSPPPATATSRPATRTATSVLRFLPASAVTPAADILPPGTPSLAPLPAEPAAVTEWPTPGLLLGLAATFLALAALVAAAGFWIWRRGAPAPAPTAEPSGESPVHDGGPPSEP